LIIGKGLHKSEIFQNEMEIKGLKESEWY